jgi:hypothetical protein
MNHGRHDYQRIQDPENKIPSGEPVFLLRGQDPLAADAVEAYAARAEAAGASEAFVASARAQADTMRRWAAREDTGTPHLPDLPDEPTPATKRRKTPA